MIETAQVTPISCPFCQSTEVAVNAKNAAAAYRRCMTCNEVWHPDRPPPPVIKARLLR